jgi:type II secretory pathway component PulF
MDDARRTTRTDGSVASGAGRALRRRGADRVRAATRRDGSTPGERRDGPLRSGRVLGGLGRPGPSGGPRPRRAGARRHAVWRPSADQLALLASLDDAGIPTDRAFATLASMSSGQGARHAVEEVAARLQRGEPLAAALHAVHAPTHVAALVLAGERVGRTGEALRGAAELMRRLERLRAAVRRALVYPAVVLVVGTAILIVVAVAVAPALQRTFADLGGELPVATVVVLRVSDALRSGRLPLIVLAGISLLIGSLRSLPPEVRTALTVRVGVAVPVVRRIRRDLDLAVLARLLATMLAAGVPLVAALRTAERALGAGHVGARIRAAADAVERGGDALDEEGLAPLLDPVEREVLRVGAATGLLAEQWCRVAERRATALEGRIERLGVVIEPVLVVLVGACVGGAVLALYLPTFRVLDLL